MYEVIIINGSNNVLIHHPSPDPDVPRLNKLNKKEKDSNADILNFTILKNNPGYDHIQELITEVLITDVRDGSVEFDGRVLKAPEKMDSNGLFYKEVTVEGSLNYLLDSKTRKYLYELKTPTQILTDLLSKHNSKVGVNRRVQLGNIEISNATTMLVDYQSTLSAVQLIKSKLGGHFKIRLQNGIRYLDYFNTVDTDINIRLGENMKDMLRENDITDMGTRLIPIGKDDLTIESVNNGIDYIDNLEAISKYGIIEKVVEYHDIEDPVQLKAQMLNDLKKHSQPKQTLESSALDLSVLSDNSIYKFTICKNIRIINPVMVIDTIYEIVEADKDLLKPYNPKLIISNTPDNLTDKIVDFNNTTSLVNKAITSEGKINTYRLDGAIDVLKHQLIASAAYSNVQVVDDKGLLFENTDAQSKDYGALYLGPGIFAIANSKTVEGNWNWRSFGTGRGFTAEELVTGILKSGDNTSYFNLENGQFKLGDQLTFDGVNLTFGNGVDVVKRNDLISQLSDYITTGKMTEALSNTLTKSNFMTTITKDYIASMNLIVGKEILMGSNAIISWTQVSDQPFIPKNANDVAARPNTWTPTAYDVGARPNTWTPSAYEVGAKPANWMPTATDVGARPANWMPSANEVGARPNTWTPTASQVGAIGDDYAGHSTVTTLTRNAITTGMMILDKLYTSNQDYYIALAGSKFAFKRASDNAEVFSLSALSERNVGEVNTTTATRVYLPEDCSIDTTEGSFRLRVSKNNYLRINKNGGLEYVYPTDGNGGSSYNSICIIDGNGVLQTGTGSSVNVTVTPKFG